MAVRVEWRTRGERDDTLLVVDDDNTVRQAVEAAPTVLRDFLNDMVGLDTWRQGPSVAEDKRSPAAWGELVIARAKTGEVRVFAAANPSSPPQRCPETARTALQSPSRLLIRAKIHSHRCSTTVYEISRLDAEAKFLKERYK